MIETLKAFVKYWREYEGKVDLIPWSQSFKVENDSIIYQILDLAFPVHYGSGESRLMQYDWQLDFIASPFNHVNGELLTNNFERIQKMYQAFNTWLIEYPIPGLLTFADSKATLIPSHPHDRNNFVRLVKRYTIMREDGYILKVKKEFVEDIIPNAEESN